MNFLKIFETIKIFEMLILSNPNGLRFDIFQFSTLLLSTISSAASKLLLERSLSKLKAGRVKNWATISSRFVGDGQAIRVDRQELRLANIFVKHLRACPVLSVVLSLSLQEFLAKLPCVPRLPNNTYEAHCDENIGIVCT